MDYAKSKYAIVDEAASAFPDVEKIHLIAPKKLADITYVAQLHHLKVLDANFAPVSSLSPFHEHQGIEEIWLHPESSSFKALEEVMLKREGNLIMKPGSAK